MEGEERKYIDNSISFDENFGSAEELVSFFNNKQDQIGEIVDHLKLAFSPLRNTVKNCTGQLEHISEILTKELHEIELLSNASSKIQIGIIENEIRKNGRSLHEFLSIMLDKLNRYLEDLHQTRQLLSTYKIQFSDIKSKWVTYEDKVTVTVKIAEINNQINLIETSINSLISNINKKLNGSTEASYLNEANMQIDLSKLLDTIQPNRKNELKLTKASLQNLQELSTFLQYEDILGQKLEHIQEIFGHIRNGIDPTKNSEKLQDQPHYRLIPELSSLIINQLNLVQSEYRTVIDRMAFNASSVHKNMSESKTANQHVDAEVQNGIELLTNIYGTVEELIGIYQSAETQQRDQKTAIEKYLAPVSEELQHALMNISHVQSHLHKSENSDTKMESALNLNEMRNLMVKIHESINSLSKTGEFPDQGSAVSLIDHLQSFKKLLKNLYDSSLTRDSDIRNKTSLSETLAKEIQSGLEQAQKSDSLDNIISSCISELDHFASQRKAREISGSEKEIFNQIKGIYSMDSERLVHDKNIEAHIAYNHHDLQSNETKSEKGSIELF